MRLPKVLVVTGTSTDVGKTIATAALLVDLRSRGARVAVVKPAQTGVGPQDAGDLQEVCRLAGLAGLRGEIRTGEPTALRTMAGEDARVTAYEGVRLRDPLAPAAVARRAGVTLPSVREHARVIAELAKSHDVVLVEGAGGLLVELDSAAGTLADLGVAVATLGHDLGCLLVSAPGLGTLNHTALTAEALRRRSLPLVGVLVGSWPRPPHEPDLAMRENLTDLPRAAGAPLCGVISDGAGELDAGGFAAAVPRWLGAGLTAAAGTPAAGTSPAAGAGAR